MLKTGAILRSHYRILHTLGERGMSGYTYLAEDLEQLTHYAIKELNPKTSDPEDYREICSRFGAESDYLGRLNGFNGQIPKFYETFKAKDGDDVEREYIVQEYIEGKTLAQFAQHMKAQGWALGELQVKEILSRLLCVVSHIHRAGFIHRDIKPQNIILRTHDRVPVLIDYGAVKEYEFTLIRKGAGQTGFVGTPAYSDEDQLNGMPTAASDLYAVGVLAVYLLTNTSPQAIRKKDGKLLWGDHVLGLSKDFFHVIDKAIEPRTSYPGQRFGSAEAMLAALNQAASAEELEEELTRLGTRQGRTNVKQRFVKCRECSWFLNFEDTNCANCGGYGIHNLTEDEAYLFDNSPGRYVAYFSDKFLTRDNTATALLELSRDEYNLVTNPVNIYIRNHTNFIAKKIPDYLIWARPPDRPKRRSPITGMFYSDEPDDEWDAEGGLRSINGKRPFRITLGEFLQRHRQEVGGLAIMGWVLATLAGCMAGFITVLEENKVSLCFSPCAAIIVVAAAVWSRSYIWYVLDKCIASLLLEKRKAAVQLEAFYRLKSAEKNRLKKKLHDNASSKKEDLEREVEDKLVAYRASGFSLQRDESSINKQLAAIGASTVRLSKVADLLDRDIREMPADISTEDQKRDRERTSFALQQLAPQNLKYTAKLEEIELLRLSNALQAEIPRQQATPVNRNEAKRRIDRMAKLSDKIYTNLKTADLTDAGSERLWLERIRLVREALMKLNKSVTSHIVDLAHQSHDEEAADFPLEVTSGLDRLSVYLTNRDFKREYQMLQAKYEK